MWVSAGIDPTIKKRMDDMSKKTETPETPETPSPTSFALTDFLIGVVTEIASTVTRTSDGVQFVGMIENRWDNVTLGDVLANYAAADRRIKWANTVRPRVHEFRGTDRVVVDVMPPNVRERVGRVVITDETALNHVADTMDRDTAIAMITAEYDRRAVLETATDTE